MNKLRLEHELGVMLQRNEGHFYRIFTLYLKDRCSVHFEPVMYPLDRIIGTTRHTLKIENEVLFIGGTWQECALWLIENRLEIDKNYSHEPDHMRVDCWEIDDRVVMRLQVELMRDIYRKLTK